MEQSSLNKVLKSAGILFSGNMMAALLGIIVVSIITKNISLEQYGIVVMLQAYVMFVDQLFNFQSWQGLIKYGTIALENNEKDDLKNYIQLSIILDIVGSILAFSFSLILLTPIAYLFAFDVELLNPYLFYAVIILFRILGTPTALLRLTEQYRYFNYQLMINWGSKLFLIIILILMNILTIYNIFIVFIIGEVLSSIYLVYNGMRVLSEFNISIKNLFVGTNIFSFKLKSKIFLLFSLKSNLSGAVLGGIRTVDELIVGALLGPASAAIFKIMKLMGTIISKILDPLYVSIYPEFSKLIAKNKINEIVFIIKKLSIINLFVSLVIIISFYYFGNVIISTIFTDEYLIGLSMIQIYLIGVLISFLFFYVHPLMLAYELEGIALVINIISSLIYILLLYVLSPYYDLWAVVISFLIFNIMVTIPKLYYIQKNRKLFFNKK